MSKYPKPKDKKNNDDKFISKKGEFEIISKEEVKKENIKK